MKVSAFKQMIKEAAREGAMEAFLEILEEKQSIKENFSFTSKDVPINTDIRRSLAQKMGAIFEGSDNTNSTQLGPVAGENPYLAFLQDTAQKITAQDRQGVGNLGEVY